MEGVNKMKDYILKIKQEENFPFNWVNLSPESGINAQSHKIEISPRNQKANVSNMKSLFHDLFNTIINELSIFSLSWWDYCLDTWDIQKNTYCYSPQYLSKETANYLIMLQKSDIVQGYSGSCICNDWDAYLSIALDCLIKGIAPYGHLIYDFNKQFFFYFHYSGSIGLYYKEGNPFIANLIKNNTKYDIDIV